MDDSVCQKNLETCADWKATLPFCNFGPIYKPGANGGEEIVFTYPAKKISAIPSLTDRASQTTRTTTKTTSLKTDVTKDQNNLHTEYSDSSRTSKMVTGIKNTKGVEPATSASVGFEQRVTVAEGGTYAHSPTVDVVPVSIGVGIFSYALGMIIVVLIFRGNNARKAALRKRRNQIESVHLIDTGNQRRCPESADGEQTENDRYQDIQSLNTDLPMSILQRNQEMIEVVDDCGMAFSNYDNPEVYLENLTNSHSRAECINDPIQSYDGNTFELKDM